MDLFEVPSALAVLGAGYVGMEQAQLFAHLGAHVTLVGPLAPRTEPEHAAGLREVFDRDGITVVGEYAAAVRPEGAGVAVTTASGRRLTGSPVLVPTGRTARSEGLGLDAACLAVDDRGFVVVDERQRSSNPRVYATGRLLGVRALAEAAGEMMLAATYADQGRDDSGRGADT